jgi:hypothetical protein
MLLAGSADGGGDYPDSAQAWVVDEEGSPCLDCVSEEVQLVGWVRAVAAGVQGSLWTGVRMEAGVGCADS